MKGVSNEAQGRSTLLASLCSCLACRGLVRCPRKTVGPATRVTPVRPGVLWGLSGAERREVEEVYDRLWARGLAQAFGAGFGTVHRCGETPDA